MLDGAGLAAAGCGDSGVLAAFGPSEVAAPAAGYALRLGYIDKRASLKGAFWGHVALARDTAPAGLRQP